MAHEAIAQAPANSILAKTDPNALAAKLARLEALEAKELKVKARYQKYGERHRATVAITLEKAKKAGIKVTPAEVDRYLAENK